MLGYQRQTKTHDTSSRQVTHLEQVTSVVPNGPASLAGVLPGQRGTAATMQRMYQDVAIIII